ncbi:melanocyte-stimulating hormone receptor-like [Acropora muricata]|uniref:melanocyte-stimulating hormone receptor-like n=1 Tax=Acropora muricata TaxID=159855 RepID=UPI0034E39766
MQSLEVFTNVFCSQEFAKALDNQIICFSVINTVLAITAIAGNTLILIALHKELSLHRPSKVLIRNLVVSDLCVGFSEVATVAQWISILQERWQMCYYFFLAHSTISITSIAVSLWALAAISIDRLLALLLGLRYRQVVTLSRVYVVTVAVWVLGAGETISFVLNRVVVIMVASTNITVCLITSTFCYTTIFFKLRKQQTLVHNSPPEQGNQTISLNISGYRKTVSTSLWLQLTLMFCYLPFLLITQFAHQQFEKKQSAAFYLPFYSAITLMFFNSTLNPILYCWKIKELRRVVLEILRCRQM